MRRPFEFEIRMLIVGQTLAAIAFLCFLMRSVAKQLTEMLEMNVSTGSNKLSICLCGILRGAVQSQKLKEVQGKGTSSTQKRERNTKLFLSVHMC